MVEQAQAFFPMGRGNKGEASGQGYLQHEILYVA